MLKNIKRISPRFSLRPSVLLLISTILYFFPYVVGSFEYRSPYGGRHAVYYNDGTIYAVSLAIFSIFIAIFLTKDRKVQLQPKGVYRYESNTLIAVIIFCAFYIFYFSPDLFSAQKSDVLEGTNRIHYIFYYICAIGLIFSLMTGWKNNIPVLIASVMGLLLALYIGHRSYLAIAIGGIAYLFLRNRSILKINPIYYIFVFFTVMFLAVYKSVYIAIKMGDFSAVRDRLLENPLTDNALIGLEQFVTFAHLDFIVTYDYSLPCTNLWAIPISIIPFMDEIIDISACGYNEQVQRVFFSAYPGGVAGNIWAEFFANFKYFGIPMVVITLISFAKIIEHFISKFYNPVIKSGLIISIIEMTVYVQRKELMSAFITAKRAIIVALFVYTCAVIIRTLSNERVKYA